MLGPVPQLIRPHVGSITLIFVLFFGLACSAAETPKVESFSEWKQTKYDSAVFALRKAQARVVQQKSKSQNGASPDYVKALRDETQAEWDVETARDLNFDDYVVGYMRSLKRPEALKAAAAKLSKQETVDLLKAYLSTLNQPQEDLKPNEIHRLSHGEE